MANDLEQVAVELEARVGRYKPDMVDAANVTERQLTRIENSATKMEREVGRSFGAAAQHSRNLGYQISDIGVQLSSGTSPFIVLAQQGPQVANAMEGAKGAVGRFATFLSGPWGAAILAGTTMLGVWLTKNKEAGESVADLVDKLKAQEAQSRKVEQAQEEFGNTLDGVSKAMEDNRKALELLNKVQDTSAETTLKATERERDRLIKIRETTVALLEQAKAHEALYTSSLRESLGAEGAAAFDARQAAELRRIDALEKQLQEAQIKLNAAQSEVREAQANVAVERASRSATEEAERYYDGLIDGARRAALASGKTISALEAEVRAINKRREARLQEIRDTESASRKSTSSLPPVTGQEIARALGTRITSGTRTPAENAAARGAKNSYHLSGQAIDIPLTVGGKPLTKAGIRAALEPLGIEIKELLGPGDKGHNDHFHIAFSKKRRGADEVAADSQRAADAEERRRQTFDNELAQLLGDEIAAQRALVESAEEIAKLRLAEIETERQAYDDNLDSLVEQGKLRAEEAEQLRQVNDQIANYRVELVKRNEDIRKFRMDEAKLQRDALLANEARADEASVLQGRADLARTLDERNDIERRLVELQYAEEKARNDHLIGYYARLKTQKGIAQSELDEAEAAAQAARIRNASIGERRGNDLEGINRNDPFGRYLDDISDTKTRAQEAVIRQLDEVRDGISDALTEDLGIKSQFVRDLFNIFLEDAVFRPLMESLRNRGSGGGGWLGSILSGIGAIFGGGGSGLTGTSGGMDLRGFGGMASGGYAEPYSIHRVNEHKGGVELLRMGSQGGTVIPLGQVNQAAAQPVTARQGPIELRVYADRGAFISDVQAISQGEAVKVTLEAAPAIIDRAANETIRRSNRPRMPGAGR